MFKFYALNAKKKLQTTPALESSYPNGAKDATILSISIVTAFCQEKCSNYFGIKWCTGSERAVLLYFVIENEHSHLGSFEIRNHASLFLEFMLDCIFKWFLRLYVQQCDMTPLLSRFVCKVFKVFSSFSFLDP